MTLNDLKGLQMSLCMPNKLSLLESFEIIWSHLSHEADINSHEADINSSLHYKNATLLKNALSFLGQWVLQTSEIVKSCENHIMMRLWISNYLILFISFLFDYVI